MSPPPTTIFNPSFTSSLLPLHSFVRLRAFTSLWTVIVCLFAPFPTLISSLHAVTGRFRIRLKCMSTALQIVRFSDIPETMSGPSAVAADNSSHTPHPKSSRRGGGRGRGNRGHRQSNNQAQTQGQTRGQPQSTDAQAQVQVPTQPSGEVSTANASGDAASRQRRGPRGGGRGGGGGGRGPRPGGGGRQRGQGREGEAGPAPRRAGVGGRMFEGRLTRPEGNATEEADGLNNPGLKADAPVFVPGGKLDGGTASTTSTKDHDSKGKSKAKNHPPPRPKITTKSVAPDIATRIHEDILHALYECPICTGELGRRSRVWSCGLCWTVFHLSCVKKWSRNEGSATQDAARRQQEDATGQASAPRAWRCPGCNLPQEIYPSAYTCWCEKEVDPRPLGGLPPHSCGQTCSRPRKGCPHPCDSICHAGPCAPCTAMGPTQDCFCGRNSSTKRCQDTDYENGWSCGEICGDLLPCGEHTCSRRCHEGLCGACDVKVGARCYCGSVQTEMLCSARDEEEDSEKLRDASGDAESWTGCFSCGELCNRPFDCGVHFCHKNCHAQDAQPANCPRSPDMVFDCPCGKTPLTNIPSYSPRTSCEDPIPHCLEACGKTLPCGHPCEKICHTGPCGACMRRVSISCRCGRNSMMTICHQGTLEQPQCFRMCKAGLHCGRHSCAERCCTGEQKALERQAMRRKLRSHLRPSDEDVEAEHICTRVCGRTLKCGRHTCPEICHKGACNTCREAIFEEITCNCGRSVLYPPLPCGTQPPSCSFPCERRKPCGHPQTQHNCHTDEESCPKCPFLTEKMCLCGKRTLKNQPCWLADVRCGQICGEPLKCGSHTCQKNCHRAGDCEDDSRPCQQACGKRKTLCGHPCTDPCHAPYPCPEKTPCPATVTVTCGCGRLRHERRCNAAKAVASKGQIQQSQRSPVVTPLTCDEECARLERNRSLASALGVEINPSTTTTPAAAAANLPYSTETLDMYIQLSSSVSLSTLQTYESTLHILAASPTQRSIRFQPAKPSLRAFAHSLAADWGFATESFDPEPHRHVFVLKPASWNPLFFGLGNGNAFGIGGTSVGECVKVRERQRMREREAQRVAVAEAKASREAAKAQQASDSAADGGWAQVAASRRGNNVSGSGNGTRSGSMTPSGQNTPSSGSMYAALAGGAVGGGGGETAGPKKEKLVLRSGVSVGKQLRSQQSAPAPDSWEEEEEKEEAQEKNDDVGQDANSEEQKDEKYGAGTRQDGTHVESGPKGGIVDGSHGPDSTGVIEGEAAGEAGAMPPPMP